MSVFFDIGPPGGEIGVYVGFAFFLLCIAAAFVVFRLLRKTLKFALRIVVVFVILAIGLLGTAVWFFIGGGHGPVKPRSAASNTRSH